MAVGGNDVTASSIDDATADRNRTVTGEESRDREASPAANDRQRKNEAGDGGTERRSVVTGDDDVSSSSSDVSSDVEQQRTCMSSSDLLRVSHNK